MGAFFITATGTDIGKTFVAAGLIRHLRATGREVDAIKPVMSGYDPSHAANSDAGALLLALDRTPTPHAVEAISPWRYRAPLSPDMAAAQENKQLDVDALIAHSHEAIAEAQGTLLIEGVGGIMVPLDGKRTVLDWMAALDIPLLLVVGGYLGAISHTLTALDVLRQRKLTIAAIVVSESERGTVELDDTVASIARFSESIEVVGLPRLPGGINDHPAFARIASLL